MGSLTNIWVPEHEKKPFQDACKHYHINTMAAFFRMCVTALIEHHKNKDQIPMPLQFRVPVSTNIHKKQEKT